MKQPNPRLIGAFVLGAVLLSVAALVYLSSQDLFAKRRRFVTYFQQSVKGLKLGAPVQFRGIPIGEVIGIEGVYDSEVGSVTPRLLLEVKPETLVNVQLPDDESEYPVLPSLISQGLRATLRSQSLLTGQLYVSLDFHPEKAVRRLTRGDDPYPELPSIDTGLDQTLAKLEDLPIEEVLICASKALASADALLSNPDLERTIGALPALVSNVDGLAVAASGAVVDLEEQLSEQTLVSAEEALEQAEQTMASGGAALEQAQRTLAVFERRASQDDALTLELLTTLRDVSAAARSIRGLAEELERHPESIVRGKQ